MRDRSVGDRGASSGVVAAIALRQENHPELCKREVSPTGLPSSTPLCVRPIGAFGQPRRRWQLGGSGIPRSLPTSISWTVSRIRSSAKPQNLDFVDGCEDFELRGGARVQDPRPTSCPHISTYTTPVRDCGPMIKIWLSCV